MYFVAHERVAVKNSFSTYACTKGFYSCDVNCIMSVKRFLKLPAWRHPPTCRHSLHPHPRHLGLPQRSFVYQRPVNKSAIQARVENQRTAMIQMCWIRYRFHHWLDLVRCITLQFCVFRVCKKVSFLFYQTNVVKKEIMGLTRVVWLNDFLTWT